MVNLNHYTKNYNLIKIHYLTPYSSNNINMIVETKHILMKINFLKN